MDSQLAPDVHRHSDDRRRSGADILRVLAALGVLAGLAALDGAEEPRDLSGQSPASAAESGDTQHRL
ncbi:MAG TPA: hypothetical protein VGO61_19010 [Steroidobacteraceae bacterium]|jgi:hypothetical protein|nr:hypothetical protein [Steroidobacteraceae bacterium]